MPLQDPPFVAAIQKRLAFRLFRLGSAVAVILAAMAIALVLQGKAEGRALALIATALGIGLFVLIGWAILTACQLKKDNNDPRS